MNVVRGFVEPLGKRINCSLSDVRKAARDVRTAVATVPWCDDELPTGSRLSESHCDDLSRACELLGQVHELVCGLMPEALELNDVE